MRELGVTLRLHRDRPRVEGGDVLNALMGYVVGQILTAGFFVWWMSRPVEEVDRELRQPLSLYRPPCPFSRQECEAGACQCEQEDARRETD